MINCKNASKRLKVEEKDLENAVNRLGLPKDMVKLKLSILEARRLVKYLSVFIPGFTDQKYETIFNRYDTMKEIILAITCYSGDIRNLEPIWITFKILMNDIILRETEKTQHIS